ncbi:hypothetical protein BK816_03185 [Boudabousia tangfeifanii]|uniref:Putative glucose-6-phosphate 1-epimerase n=1 Tax=Boudabousia tangfeifanii TaxID=1912795 RepID=A0A1D9MJD7_9ACTO|nr:D-hexose-6-phosphate mutarotase [Boudabousia tangfeifanii]AOZ72417.1 hypothetical protein BK816_03185 [Boudabousia tangfeifanii]
MTLEKTTLSSDFSTAEVYEQGAHLATWTPKEQPPVIWTSTASKYEVGTGIRGGIPIVFPWFNAGRKPGLTPRHGFVRFENWQLVSGPSSKDGETTATWELNGPLDNENFPYKFRARFEVKTGKALSVALVVENLDTEEFDCELAFHTYFHVGDTENTRILGFNGASAKDPFISPAFFRQEGELESAAEIDRVFFTPPNATIVDRVNNRVIRTHSENASNAIVWNPGPEGAKEMADLQDDDWKRFFCLETACIYDNAVVIKPGESFTLDLQVQVESLNPIYL